MNQAFSKKSILSRKRRKNGIFTLRLTSMIDMFTILLVFLLKNYTTENQVPVMANDLRLPSSTAQKIPETASVVGLTRQWVLLDGKKMARVSDVLKSDNLLIKNLFLELRAKRLISERLASYDSKMKFRGEITIQGDKDLPFQLLKKVMYTCGQVGYNNMQLAVIKKE
ncbi:MAG: biopolymer transporter ExbD [Calditrichaeota bacterium]|nr:biopolymer transporter ExbD [Calditrichota bacterium]